MEKMILSKNRKILLGDVLGIPGLRLFGHNVFMKATTPIEIHTHGDYYEFVLVVKGTESYFVEGKRFSLSKGDIFVSFQHQPHSSADSKQDISEIYWFQINPAIREDFLSLSKTTGEIVRKQILGLKTHTLKADNECISLVKKSFDAFLHLNPQNRLYAQSLFVAFLSRLFFIQQKFSKEDIYIQKCIEYIDKNICNRISMDELCQISNKSLSAFKCKFRDLVGETPRTYINRRKILKAKELLAQGMNITETAMLLSFNSSDYFSVVFKKYTNSTPTEYVQNLQKL